MHGLPVQHKRYSHDSEGAARTFWYSSRYTPPSTAPRPPAASFPCFGRSGLGRCPGSTPLWRSAARLEEQEGGNVARARALLEQARLKNPKTDELWLAAIRTEQRAGNEKAADSVLAKALQVGGAVL
jgi:hypothetical protein